MKVFADVGELGWAMYLSAHINWLMASGNKVLVYTDRPGMYECDTKPVPEEFKEKFKDYPADCFGRYGVRDADLREYLPRLEKFPGLCCDRTIDWTKEKTIYRPYKPGGDYIIVFPRVRHNPHHAMRNLPCKFYEDLIDDLLLKYQVLLAGTLEEAYNIERDNPRFRSLIGRTNISHLIGLSTNATVAIWGTSAPPKIAMLQGTPTVVIGHEKERFEKEENWSKAPLLFCEIEDYSTVEYSQFKEQIRGFVYDSFSMLHNKKLK